MTTVQQGQLCREREVLPYLPSLPYLPFLPFYPMVSRVEGENRVTRVGKVTLLRGYPYLDPRGRLWEPMTHKR